MISVSDCQLRIVAATDKASGVSRGREYLTEREVEAAKQNRAGHRDPTAILVALALPCDAGRQQQGILR
jgi:hypothetical protein